MMKAHHMTNKTTLSASLICIFLMLTAPLLGQENQDPAKGFNYQAVARDNDGQIMSNNTINLRISILENASGEDPSAEAPVFVELHQVTTSPYGMFNLTIGRGIPYQGNFKDIRWGESAHWLQVEMDTKNNGDYFLLGMSEILTVPYAIHAKEAEKLVGDWAETATSLWHDGEGEPVADLGTENDYYLDITTANIYKKTDDAWQFRGTLKTGGTESSRDDPNDWTMEGNSGTTPTFNFLGTTDNVGLAFRINNVEQMRLNNKGLVVGQTSTPSDHILTLRQKGNGNTYGLKIINSGNTRSARFFVGSNGTVFEAEGASTFMLRTANTDRLFVKSTGEIGIGTKTPTNLLDVEGTAEMDGFQLNTGAVDKYILQTDASGVGNWINPESALGWQRSSNTHVYNTGDSVGINTSDPIRPLHIMGSTTLSSMILTPNEPFSGDDANIIFAEDDDNTYHMHIKYDGNDNRMYWYGKNNASINGPHMGINRDNGRVGIGTGTTNPVSELQVVGTVTATAFDAGDASGLINVYADSLRGSMQADTNDILQWNGAFWNRIPYGRYGFHASASTDQTVGDTAYDTLRCNNSSSGENFECPAGVYDNATYAFEAPVDGIYWFEAAVLWDNSTLAETRNAIFIRVNNTDEVGEWSASGGTDFFGTGVSTTLELNKGDEVRIRIYNGDSANSMDTFSQSGKYCYFSGFLVFAQ